MSQIYPNVLADIIISYTQRNNEPIGYFEHKAHMPKEIVFNTKEPSPTEPPKIGSIGYWESNLGKTKEPFIVVRNSEWPLSLLIICAKVSICKDEVIFMHDFFYADRSDFVSNHPRLQQRENLDDYLYTVLELQALTSTRYIVPDSKALSNIGQDVVAYADHDRAFTQEQIDEIAKQSNGNLSNKQRMEQ